MRNEQEMKWSTCIHSTGRHGELIVDVKLSCPNYMKINGRVVSSKAQCKWCRKWKPKKGVEQDEEPD